MIQYTTPTIHLVIEGVDLTPYEIYVTIEQGSRELTVTNGAVTYDEEGDGCTHIRVALSQAQTGTFRVGDAKVQVNWVGSDGMRNATVTGKMRIDDNLLDREVPYGG